MTYEEFLATAAPVSDETWAAIQEDCQPPVGREAHHQYAEGFALYEHDGAWWPYAWWYSPARYESRSEAEGVLFRWRAEFA